MLKDDGTPAGVGEDGHLVITAPWPGMLRGQWGDADGQRFKEVYFSMFKGVFTTGDGCAIDADGDHWLKGRIDDVLNVAGHRIGTAEVESALVSHPKVAEAAVVGQHDPEWGEIVVAFVVPRAGAVLDALELDALCLAQIARFKRPKRYEIVDALPKNNYGKVLKTELRQRLKIEVPGARHGFP